MLKQLVVVKDPSNQYYGQTGVVVAVSTGHHDQSINCAESVCKILFGSDVSGWIPEKSLEVINDASRSDLAYVNE